MTAAHGIVAEKTPYDAEIYKILLVNMWIV